MTRFWKKQGRKSSRYSRKNAVKNIGGLTSERHGAPCLGVHLHASRPADLADPVAHRVAPVLAAVETHAAVEGVAAAAPVGRDGVLLVQKGVDEQMDGALVFTLHRIGDG